MQGRREFMGAMFAWGAGAGPAWAAGVSAAEAKQVRGVVQAQLDALAADDATKAFSYATPALRSRFGTAENFIEMVRTGYPVVLRPASVAFLKPERVDGGVVQAVQMSDASGAVWLAIYQLQRQRDKSWRIAGCELVRGTSQMT